MMLGSGVTKRSRHFEIDWFKTQDLVEQGELVTEWISTLDNLADFFTKKLPREKFERLRDSLMGRDDEMESIARLLRADEDCVIARKFQMRAAFAGIEFKMNEEIERKLEGMYEKFGDFAGMALFLPQEILNWEGQWLLRVVAPPFSHLIACGTKKVENIPVSEWIKWGVQGVIVTAIFETSKVLSNAREYMPG